MSTARFALVVLGLTVFAVIDGLLLGATAGLLLRPPPSSAPLVSTDEYVMLVSVAYAQDGDLDRARERIALLYADDSTLADLLSDVATRYSSQHATAVQSLARALNLSASKEALARIAAPAATPTPTLVLKPTDTPSPASSGVQVAALAAPATRTATAIRAATPTRTRTPAPTATRRRPTATPTARPAATATSTKPPPAAPGVNYRVKLVRRLTACENGGNHHLHILVLDAQGSGIPGKWVEIVWASGSFQDVTGKKSEYIPFLGVTPQTTAGYLNYPMYHGSYRARVLDGVSEQTGWLTVDIPVDEYCAATDNPQGNSLYHYSYLIVFQRTY